MLFFSQATLEMKGVKEMKALLDILELDSSVYVRIQVSEVIEAEQAHRSGRLFAG